VCLALERGGLSLQESKKVRRERRSIFWLRADSDEIVEA
jgi:hypothetical protein